jgi:hypothetical protein
MYPMYGDKSYYTVPLVKELPFPKEVKDSFWEYVCDDVPNEGNEQQDHEWEYFENGESDNKDWKKPSKGRKVRGRK